MVGWTRPVTYLKLGMAVAVTLVWAAAWIAAIIRKDYSGAGGLTPIMVLVVGGVFGSELRKAARNGARQGEHE